MDIRLALIAGSNIPIPECQLTLHQPKLNEISFVGETDFFKGVQTLTLYKSMFTEGKSDLEEITNFQIFMKVMTDKTTIDKKSAVQKVLLLTFPEYNVLFTPMSLIFQKNKENFVVDENNFEALQEILREIFCSKTGPMDQQAFNPEGAKAKEIAEKLMRGRKRIAEQKNADNSSVFSQYISSLSIGLHRLPTEMAELTMYQLYDLVERYMLQTNWDIDLRARLAGAKPDSQPENQMKNIH